MIRKSIILLALFFFATIFSQKVNAITYELTAPQEQLKRGEQVQFTVYINTEGTTVTTSQIGANYETQYLEYVSTSPGAAMSSVAVTPQGDGKFLLTGTNTSGFSGEDVFAYLNFKIIAEASGSTELCALWAPTTPTVNPTVPGSTIPPQNPPLPTSLPKTGDSNPGNEMTRIGGMLVASALGLFVLRKKIL